MAMNKFGVIELASAKTTSAPGWAYVPDTRQAPGAGAASNRKRARNVPGLSIGDLSARQEAKIRKEVEALDKDGGKDSTIPLPVKAGRAQEKHTPNVRKILQSQKTFNNHLDDFLALGGTDTNLVTSNNTSRPSQASANASKRPQAGKKDSSTPRQALTDQDITMADANLPCILPPPYKDPPPAHPGDDNPLLASRVPQPPSDEELRRLLAHPPLTYVEAQGTWEDKYPMRTFCQVCGYWGRVRCMKCGTRVCALDCLETHREDCVTRYGL